MNLRQRLVYAGFGFAIGLIVAIVVLIWLVRKYPPYLQNSEVTPMFITGYRSLTRRGD